MGTRKSLSWTLAAPCGVGIDKGWIADAHQVRPTDWGRSPGKFIRRCGAGTKRREPTGADQRLRPGQRVGTREQLVTCVTASGQSVGIDVQA